MGALRFSAELELDGAGQGWTDVTRDVLVEPGVRWDWGLRGAKPRDRVAGVGECRFALDDAAGPSGPGAWTPGAPTARAGFDTGIGCRLTLAAGPFRRRKLYHVDGAAPTFGEPHDRRTEVAGIDWMGLAARQEVGSLPIQRDLRTDELLAVLVALVPTAPRAERYGAGVETPPFAFDDLDTRATVLQAISRTAMSEYGYVWAGGTGAGGDGEELRFAERTARQRARLGTPAADIRSAAAIGLSRAATAELVSGARVRLRQRRVDASPTTVLAEIDSAVDLPGSGLTMHMPYRDPDQAAERVAGVDMVDPVAGTDYAAEDGGGADRTADVTVTAEFGGRGADVTVTNGTAAALSLTKLQLRGRGLYAYREIDVVRSVAGQQQALGVLTVRMPYTSAVAVAESVANQIVRQFGAPLTRATSFTLHAARDDDTARLACELDVGSLVDVHDPRSNVASQHFIQRVSVDVRAPDDIQITYDLSDPNETLADVWAVGRSRLGRSTRLG